MNFIIKILKIEWNIESFQEFEFDKNIDNLSRLFSFHIKNKSHH